MLNTFYDVLEIEENATADEIKQAYQNLAQVWHPDKNRQLSESIQQKAHNKTIAINEAYSMLRDPAKKQAYDAAIRRAREDYSRKVFDTAMDAADELHREQAGTQTRAARAASPPPVQTQKTSASPPRSYRTKRTVADEKFEQQSVQRMHLQDLKSRNAQMCLRTRAANPQLNQFQTLMRFFTAGFGLLSLTLTVILLSLNWLPLPIPFWYYGIATLGALGLIGGTARQMGFQSHPFFHTDFLFAATWRIAVAAGLAWASQHFLVLIDVSGWFFHLPPTVIVLCASFALLATLVRKFEFGHLLEQDQDYNSIRDAVKGFKS